MNGIPSLHTAQAYVNYVGKVTGRDPGRRAALRRSLGRPVVDIGVRRAHAVVAPWLPHERDLPTARMYAAVESAYYTVAALVAARPAGRDQEADPQATPATESTSDQSEPEEISLGHTLGLAVRDGKANAETVEARLHLLCRQDVAGLHRHLHGLIRLLQSKDVQVDMARLLVDLSLWGLGRDRVAKQWLQDFYRAMNQTSQDQNTAEADGQEGEDK